jgi:hypothetical protein
MERKKRKKRPSKKYSHNNTTTREPAPTTNLNAEILLPSPSADLDPLLDLLDQSDPVGVDAQPDDGGATTTLCSGRGNIHDAGVSVSVVDAVVVTVVGGVVSGMVVHRVVDQVDDAVVGVQKRPVPSVHGNPTVRRNPVSVLGIRQVGGPVDDAVDESVRNPVPIPNHMTMTMAMTNPIPNSNSTGMNQRTRKATRGSR